jgi:UDP-N-acetylglucosamine acyltransferase
MGSIGEGTARIHESAIVSPHATLAATATVGPNVVIGDHVVLGDHCSVGPFTVIEGPSRIGRNNRFYGHCSIGTDPQDLKYAGEETLLEMGDDNVVREFVTINRGTSGGGGLTKLGNRNLLMTGVHVAHDCNIGSDVIFANAATLAGHIDIGDHSTIGAFTGVHQFCRVGAHAFVGGYSVITRDALPFVKTVGARGDARIYGINKIGLERKGFSENRIRALTDAYKILFRKGLTLKQALVELENEIGATEDTEALARFIATSKRGFVR